jgi:hypothetical protein
MDSKGNLVSAQLKEAFARYEGPVDTKVADREMLVDACIAKDGEFRSLCYLQPLDIFLNWPIIFFDSKLLFCYSLVWIYLFPLDKT